MVARQREADDIAAIWVRELGDRPNGRIGHFAIETLRTLALLSAASIGERDEPAAPEEIARLALALSRIESAGRLSDERERAIAAESEAKAAARAGKAARKAGLSRGHRRRHPPRHRGPRSRASARRLREMNKSNFTLLPYQTAG